MLPFAIENHKLNLQLFFKWISGNTFFSSNQNSLYLTVSKCSEKQINNVSHVYPLVTSGNICITVTVYYRNVFIIFPKGKPIMFLKQQSGKTFFGYIRFNTIEMQWFSLQTSKQYLMYVPVYNRAFTKLGISVLLCCIVIWFLHSNKQFIIQTPTSLSHTTNVLCF